MPFIVADMPNWTALFPFIVADMPNWTALCPFIVADMPNWTHYAIYCCWYAKLNCIMPVYCCWYAKLNCIMPVYCCWYVKIVLHYARLLLLICQIEQHYAVYCYRYVVFSNKPLIMLSSYAGDRSIQMTSWYLCLKKWSPFDVLFNSVHT